MKDFGRRAAACVLAVTMTFSTVPAGAAGEAILGSIVFTGTAYSATPTTDWAPLTANRPLVAGDRLKTGKDSSLVADFAKLGLVGLYADSEMAVTEKGGDVVVDAQRGKVAFYLAQGSPLKLTAGGATIAAVTAKAEGYVQYNDKGVPELVVESDNVSVVVAGATKVFARGDKIALTEAATTTASASADERKAGVLEPPPEKRHRISPLGWTAIAGAVAAVGIGVGVGVGAGGGGGGGGDSNGSE
jgi:hypothetical protein